MLTFFKINSEQDSEWDDNPNDLSIFIVIIASVQHVLLLIENIRSL